MSHFPLKPFDKIPFLDFMKHRQFWIWSSIAMVILTIGLLTFRGLNFGIDFVGGKLVQVSTPATTNVATIRDVVEQAGFNNVTIQEYGSAQEFLIRLPGNDPKAQVAAAEESILRQLKASTGEGAQLTRVEFVGPQVGQELRGKALIAILLSFAAITSYIALRFEFRYAVGALISLFHDVTLTIGVLCLLQTEVTLTVLAAILTLIGYSLNDTIVIFDRIRENRSRYPNRPLAEVLNLSVNQTLSRTIMTVMTTAIVLVAILLVGGEVIHDFAFILLVGVALGTYSSVFVAAPFLLLLENLWREKPKTDNAG